MHREHNMLGVVLRPQALPWHSKWKRYVRGLDFSKKRHHMPYAPSGVLTFAFGMAFAVLITVNQFL